MTHVPGVLEVIYVPAVLTVLGCPTDSLTGATEVIATTGTALIPKVTAIPEVSPIAARLIQ